MSRGNDALVITIVPTAVLPLPAAPAPARGIGGEAPRR